MSDNGGDSEGTFGDGPISQNVSFAGWKPGDIIDGRLQITELIGKGGMGVVWRVHHREWNRELAVKMPLPALVGSPTARERFLREAETWIDLGVHPHIVQCWFVMDISGLPSLFLDFLTGGSLKQWIDGGHVRPGQWQRILEITIQVCEGLTYAHSRGVIHRDIKPANLLIRGDERVCVTDFGIVKTAGSVDEPIPVGFTPADLPKNLSITATGAFLGTPQYGAPEQWGSAEEVDVGADIYALGITLYEMCCGRRPFDSDTERLAPEVLIDRHLTTPAPDPRKFYPEVPADLAEICLRCLEKDPRRRPESMLELQACLEGIYRRLVGTPYRGVGNVPSEQRPDTLNNRAVSLYSLAKREDARDVWRRGLRIESGHAECLYNLTQVDKKAGRLDAEEALRRLRQARAGLPLALLCIEEAHSQEAVDVLRSLKDEEANSGPVQRALGDALMYSQQYYAAEKAYRSALSSMPADVGSQERKRLASLGKRALAGRILFPSSGSTFHVVVSDKHVTPLMLHDSNGVVGVTEKACTLWNIDEECLVLRTPRAQGATAVRRLWSVPSLMLAEDQDSFELRRLPDLTLLGRKAGQIVTVTRSLERIMVADRSGVFVFDVRHSILTRLEFGPDMTGEGRLLACFDHTGSQLCLLLPTGQIAQPDEDNKVTPELWPDEVEDAADATCLLLSHNGAVLYVGHASGRLQALHFGEQRVTFDLRLPYPIRKIELASSARTLVVSMDPGFVIVDRHGSVLCQGDGPAVVDYQRNRALVFHQGRLELFDLRPFRRLRVWNETVQNPRALSLGLDGRRATSTDAGNRIDIWEVDEDSRVFERFFLLSPGRSYAEIVSASKQFHDLLGQAEDALVREQVGAAYRNLNRARSVDGYAQSPEALDMNWRLLSTLRRGKLEAVWERLNFDGDGERPGPIALSRDGHHLLVTFGSVATLYFDDGIETRSLWAVQTREDVLAATFLRSETGEEAVLLLDRKGEGGLYQQADGKLLRKITLGRGPLNHISLRGSRAYYSCPDGSIGAYDTALGRKLGEVAGLIPPLQRFFPYSMDTVIVSGEEGFGTVPLSKGKANLSSIKMKGMQIVSPLSYARFEKKTSLLHLGFEDGSLAVCDTGKSKPVFQLSQAASGAISGFQLVPSLSVGIASTSSGQLLFFDLHSGVLLEEFSAHRGKIQQLCVSASGRYVATAARGGHVRLWETSWTACEDESEPPLDWVSSPTRLSKFSLFLGLGGKAK